MDVIGTSPEEHDPARAADDDAFLWRARPGSRRAQANPPVVFLPGLGPHSTGRTRPQRLIQRLELLGVDPGSTVWVVGRRSALPVGTTIADLAAGHARAIQERFREPVDVLGESTGGSIALQLARDHPDLVRRLVVVSAASRLHRDGHTAQRSVVDHLRAGRPRRAAGAMLAATTRSRIQRPLLGVAGYLLGRFAIGSGDQDLIVTVEAENRLDLREGLARVSARTVIVGGSRDGYYSPEIFTTTAEAIPDAEYVELPRKGHVTAMTNHAVRQAIRSHLRDR